VHIAALEDPLGLFELGFRGQTCEHGILGDLHHSAAEHFQGLPEGRTIAWRQQSQSDEPPHRSIMIAAQGCRLLWRCSLGCHAPPRIWDRGACGSGTTAVGMTETSSSTSCRHPSYRSVPMHRIRTMYSGAWQRQSKEIATRSSKFGIENVVEPFSTTVQKAHLRAQLALP
jgi:hypothetical protein